MVVPGDRPSGRRHCDADYGHQPGQVRPLCAHSAPALCPLCVLSTPPLCHVPSLCPLYTRSITSLHLPCAHLRPLCARSAPALHPPCTLLQINFWLPLAPAHGHNTLWVEGLDGAAAALPLEGGFGALHRFHGHRLSHFTRPNTTPHTRVSLDFRVVPGPCYEDDYPGSRDAATGRQQFFVGGFYAVARRDGALGAWRVCDEGEGGGEGGGGGGGEGISHVASDQSPSL